jgi:taurine dioxygenase
MEMAKSVGSTLDVRPLTSAVGAELLGVDLAAAQSPQTWKDIAAALQRYGVVFFRDQVLAPAQQVEFARRFGDVSAVPLLGDVDGYAELGEVRKEPDQRDATGNIWHTDQSARTHPVRATVLLAREVPAVGGDTCFISMVSAYEALSEGMKSTLEGLRAIHSEARVLTRYSTADVNLVEEARQPSQVTHPVVIRLPEDGRKALYVNPSKTVCFEGWTPRESAGLLEYLYQHAQRPEFMCRFRWRDGSMAFWDNYQTWHYAVNDYHGQRRLMHRTVIVSELFR